MLAVLEEEAGRSFGRDSQWVPNRVRYGSWASAPEQLAKQKNHPEDTPFGAIANLHNLLGGSWQYG